MNRLVLIDIQIEHQAAIVYCEIITFVQLNQEVLSKYNGLSRPMDTLLYCGQNLPRRTHRETTEINSRF